MTDAIPTTAVELFRQFTDIPEEFRSAPGRRAVAVPIEHTCDRSDVSTCECTKKRLTQRQQQRRRAPSSTKQNRDSNLRRLYGITLAEYDAMRAAQDYRCAACGRHEDELPVMRGRSRADGEKPAAAGTRLAVDHCHEGGQIRGLLCHGCNVAIGLADEDAARLRALADYVERYCS